MDEHLTNEGGGGGDDTDILQQLTSDNSQAAMSSFVDGGGGSGLPVGHARVRRAHATPSHLGAEAGSAEQLELRVDHGDLAVDAELDQDDGWVRARGEGR